MKTQVLKNRETVKASNSMVMATIIIFGGLLLYANNRTNPHFGISFPNFQKQYEFEQLVAEANQSGNTVNREMNAIETSTADIQSSMEIIQEYIIPDNEPELEISEVLSITFPDAEPVELTITKTLSNDQFLKDLKIQASEKTNKTLELYALEMKMKEYLTVETEQPLQLESWMTDEKCWCRSLQEPTALTEQK